MSQKKQAGRSKYEEKSIRLLWGSRTGPDYRTRYRHKLRPAEPAAYRFTRFKSRGTAGTNGYGHGVGGSRGTEAGADGATSSWHGAAGRRWRGRKCCAGPGRRTSATVSAYDSNQYQTRNLSRDRAGKNLRRQCRIECAGP